MNLFVTKAKDREKMAQAVETLCAEYGAGCDRQEFHGDREIMLRLSFQAATVGLGFDGDSAQDRKGVFCLPWNIHHDVRDKVFSQEFSYAAGAPVNPHHRLKCMVFSHGFDGEAHESLLSILRRCFECIKSGEAFSDVEPRPTFNWKD